MKYKPRSFTTNVTDERLGAGSYFKVLTCPATATVSFKLGSTDVDPVPLNENDSSDFEHQDSIYVSIENLLPGEVVMVIHADGDFSINNEASNTNIGSYNAAALLQLGKMFEPYEFVQTTYASSQSAISTSILNKTLTCDKVKITINSGLATAGTLIRVIIGGSTFSRITTSGTNKSEELSSQFYDVKGLNIDVTGYNQASDPFFVLIHEYNLKA